MTEGESRISASRIAPWVRVNATVLQLVQNFPATSVSARDTFFAGLMSVNGAVQTLETALSPSRAIAPATEPYWVGETDGPKHLYILELDGDTAAYLKRSAEQVDGQSIIKVGFSRSPSARRDQIQSAYPNGQFKWVVRYPAVVPDVAPYPNARIAIFGEDAMKKRLVDENAEVLGGEFFLAEDWLVHNTWGAGRFAAEGAMQSIEHNDDKNDGAELP